MPIDYSKWDKIELSDDSDIEVHPNVDKNSFIKWKQRDIHEKRQQRNIEIKSILVQLTMYAKLNERVDFLLSDVDEEQLLDDSLIMKKLNDKFDKTEKFDYDLLKKEKGDTLRKGLKDLSFSAEEIDNTPPYNEMIEDLFIQVKEDHPDAAKDAAKLTQYLKEHRAKIDDVLSRQAIKLDDLLYQKSMLISSDDIHTGFDKSFLNKEKEDDQPAPPAPASQKKTVTTTETINNASNVSPASKEPKSDKDVLDELTLNPSTAEFGKISSTNIDESANYLIRHTHICNEQQKDALIMTAFDHQLQGDTDAARQVIHQSLLLQYVAQLAGVKPNKDLIIKAVKLFCSKINDKSSPARMGFSQDVTNTFNHIKSRCEIIKQEQGTENNDNEEEALIQLKALDDKTELLVNIPQEGSPEFQIFSTKLSKEMQDAVKTESLDAVNNVFAKLKVEEAENILEIFNECGVIGINGYIEDENEFKELQKQYNEGMDLEAEKLEEIHEELNTEDTVD
jgi:cell division cycle protein 37